jgi:hypothetical protein
MIFGYVRRSPNVARAQIDAGLMIESRTFGNIFRIELDTLAPDVIRQAGPEAGCPPILVE